jgi:hypothetical protein
VQAASANAAHASAVANDMRGMARDVWTVIDGSSMDGTGRIL